MSNQPPPELTSPPWQPGTRLAVGVILILLAMTLLTRLQQLLLPVVLALLLAYLLHPMVTLLQVKLRARRSWAVLIVYLALVLLLVGATTVMGLAVSQQIGALLTSLNAISAEIPDLLGRLSSFRLSIGPWTVDLSTINLEPILTSLSSALQPLLARTGQMVASLAGTAASLVGILVAMMVLGYYLLLDFGKLGDALISMVPTPYQEDFRRLLNDTGRVWQAFVRGQVLLGLIVGAVVAVVLAAVGVRLALVLGLIAGLLEFVPIFGPVLAGLISVLVALFQGGNLWGLEPLWFGSLVLVAFVLIQQIENNVLVPKIIGHSLNLHPLLVLLGVLAGGALAGVLGLLLAAPTIATLRLWVGYCYRKVVGLETWPGPVLGPSPRPAGPRIWRALKKARNLRRVRDREDEMEQGT